jgi:hypothetical protein
MAEHKPHPANVPGDFCVEDGCCTMCEVPFAEAAELFGTGHEPYPHCFVKRQPTTPHELTKMLNAIRCAELRCIRYRGTDRRIQLELVETEDGFVCDHFPGDLQQRVDEQEEARKHRPWWKFWA